jgi:hypothetical protein
VLRLAFVGLRSDNEIRRIPGGGKVPNERWFIWLDGQQHKLGPMSRQQVEHLNDAGMLGPTDGVWTSSSKIWRRASELFSFDPLPLPPPEPPKRKRRSIEAIANFFQRGLGSPAISRASCRFFNRMTRGKKIAILLLCSIGLLVGSYRVFEWYLQRAIVSSIFEALREAGERQQARLQLLAAYFECGAGPQDTGTATAPRTDLLQTIFVSHDGDHGFSFVTDSKWILVENGQKKVSTVHFSVDWLDINHVTIDDNVLYFYCQDCTRQIQGDINSFLNKDTDVPARLKTPVMTYTFCDADTARDTASTIDAITGRSLSKHIYEDDKDPVEASTIDP